MRACLRIIVRMYGFIFKIKLLSKIPFWCAILRWNYLRRINDVVMVAFENTSKCDHKNLMPTAKCQFSAEVNFLNYADLVLEFLFLSSIWSNVIVLFIFIFDLICIHVTKKEWKERNIYKMWWNEMKWVFCRSLRKSFFWMNCEFCLPICTRIQFAANEISKSSSNNKQLPEKW